MNFDVASIRSAYDRGEMKPAEVARQVEAMFMEILVESMEQSIGAEGGLYGDSASSDIYRGMFRQELAAALGGDLESPLRRQLEEALSGGSDPGSPAASSPEVLPVDGTISSGRGWRRDPISGEMKFHYGTDIAAPEGTPIRAAESGRVVESGPKGGYGNAVVVETADGRTMLYAHNLENHVSVGERIRRGDVIGRVGSTGRSTGPHVHFEVSE